MDISLDWLNKKKPGKTAEFLNLEYIDTNSIKGGFTILA